MFDKRSDFVKKLFTLILVVLVLLVGCNTAKPNNKSEKGDFRFCSLEWGTDWETVQKSDILKNAEVLKENGERKTVKLEKGEYLGTPIGDIGLVFDTNGVGDTAGLVTVMVQYEEEYEKTLLTKLEELYGERKNTYIDKNGVENPINPAGWVSNDTIESVLTEQEKEYYLDMVVPRVKEQTRIDALLRSPLVSIRLNEELNFIEFNGNYLAIVSYIQAELKK